MKAGTFRSAWAHRRWRWLLASFTVSMTGDFLYSIALVVFLLETTGSAGWVAAAMIARLVPYVLLSAPAGVLADRYDRRRLMINLDLLRAGFLAGMAVVVWTDGPAIVAIVLAVGSSAATTPYRPAVVAATPLLVGEDDLGAANAAESVIGQAAWFVGPALGAAIVAVSDPGTVFAIDAGTFVVSALLVTRLGSIGGGTAGEEPTPTSEASAETSAGLAAGLVEGVRAVRSDRGLAALMIFMVASLFTFGAEQVLHVVVAVEQLGLEPEWVGVMAAAIGAGGLLVAPFTARLARSPRIGLWCAASGVGMALPLSLLAVITSPGVALAVLAVEGASLIVFEVMSLTLLQRACGEDLLGRVDGLQESTTALSQLLGSLISPILVTVASLGVALWVGGGVSIVVSLAVAPALYLLGARADAERTALAPTVERLRRLSLFSEATDAALERIARAAQRVTVAAGEVVLVEGDPAEDLYVIDTGELLVRSRGDRVDRVEREVNRMGPDDWFGEIGLLRGIARTATVEAATTCELLRIPGQVFLDAMGEPEFLPDPVRRMMTTRLARTHPSHLREPT